VTGLETTGTFVLPGGASVLFTTKADGNMSSVGGTDAQDGAGNRERLRLRLGLAALARGYQVHGSAVQIVTAPGQDPPDNDSLAHADGQVTCLEGVGVTVLSADCLPIAVAGEGSVGVLHAGWRGLAAGVIGQGVAALREVGAKGPLHAVVGPCAGACCYEVGPEVHSALDSPVEGRANIDLRAIAHRMLAEAGVATVRDLDACTICDERFFSHRREGERAGRMAAVAWLS
jgi:YfiH family protein